MTQEKEQKPLVADELVDEREELKKQANADWKAPVEVEKKVRLRVLKLDKADESKDVFVSVNFKPYQIKYDESVEVPISVLQALQNTNIVTMVQDARTEKLTPVTQPRFAVQLEAA